MTTFADLIEDTREHLMTGHPDRLNVLAADITSVATSLTLSHEAKGISDGSIIVIDLEVMYVVSLSTSTLTVIREMSGSVAAAHVTGAKIYVNPQFSNHTIAKRLNNTLDNLSANGLFQVRRKVLATNTVALGYDLASLTDFIDPIRVKYSTPGPVNNWPVLRRDQYWVDQSANPTDFPSGVALILREGVPSGQSIDITYKSGFVHLATVADDVEVVSGLHLEAHDLPPMYAAITLLAGREIKRSFLNRQPEPRRSEEVPPGHANQSMRPLIELFYTRLDTEVKRLKRKYPGSI